MAPINQGSKEAAAITQILAARLLYGEEPDYIPDPNRAENIPAWKARQKQKAQELEKFMMTQAKPIFDIWKQRIQQTNLAVLYSPETDKCTCDVCLKLREIKQLVLTMHEMHMAYEQNEKLKQKEETP